MAADAAGRGQRRADLTFRHNINVGRHGWLRLTPAYSVRVVEQLLARPSRDACVFDPYSGTGTTALLAAEHGLSALATDINPFLVWFGGAKTRRYTRADLEKTALLAGRVMADLERGSGRVGAPPPLYAIERWWDASALAFLCRVRGALDEHAAAETAPGALLRVAFCRTLLSISNASFNHQSVSFRDARERAPRLGSAEPQRYQQQLAADIDHVLASARQNPAGRGRIVLDDARFLTRVPANSVDLVITSPPYPNRMSYVRELRPYMYWLGFLSSGRDAGELDWRAIGGTWGIATSRLRDWQAELAVPRVPALRSALRAISRAEPASAKVLAKYVERYFHDTWQHLLACSARLKRRAELHYVVGNSSFYDALVPTERIYASFFAELGLTDIVVTTLRKRNSKKELYEFDVSARRGPG